MPGGVLRMRLLYPCRDGYVQLYIWGGKMGEASNQGLQAWMEEKGVDTSSLQGTGWPLRDIEKVTPEAYQAITDFASQFLANYTKEELYEGALKNGVMLAPVSTMEDICHSRQLKERDFWVDVRHDELADSLRYPGPWAKLTGTPLERWERAPRIGEHNGEIYVKELQMSPAEREHLTRLGVI